MFSLNVPRVLKARASNDAVRLLVLSSFALIAAIGASSAHAGSIVVGRSGPTNGCTVPSIQAAINRANGFGGYNVILVTDDVANEVYRENLNLTNLRSDLRLEIIGGFNNCRDLTPTAFGKASIYGGGTNAPVMNIEGQIDLVMRGFWMEGGTNGIAWNGRGRVELNGVTVNNNRQMGVQVKGEGAAAQLVLSGGVVSSNNQYHGISIGGSSTGTLLKMTGAENAIVSNGASGIQVFERAALDIGARGDVIRNNSEYGIAFMYEDASNSGAPASYVYSTAAADPLGISSNAVGGIAYVGTVPTGSLCLKNIALRGNVRRGVTAYGTHARVVMNGAGCAFPPEADIICDDINYLSCNTFYNNGNGAWPLIRAYGGANIAIDRALLYRNNSTSLLSTNLGGDPSAASITLTQSVVLDNTVRDNLFEALNGGIVDIWDSTVLNNAGGFGVSLVSINPGLLQLTNTILDQPQTLLTHTGNNANVRLNRVLAQNQTGAESLARSVWTGRPTYRDTIGRLSPFSMGVDYAPAGGGVDRDRNPRDVDTTDIPNALGPRDLGAFEVQETTTDRIFAGGFQEKNP